MTTEYEKARDAAAEAFADSPLNNGFAEWSFVKGADWGRAWESPAVKVMRGEVEACIGYLDEAIGNNTRSDHRIISVFNTLKQIARAYDAECAGSGEK